MRTTKSEIKSFFIMHAAIAGIVTTVFLIAALPKFIGSGPALNMSDTVHSFNAVSGHPYSP